MKANETTEEPRLAILVSVQAKKQKLAEVKKLIEKSEFKIPSGPALINGQWW